MLGAIVRTLISLILCCIATSTYALPFIITPAAPLPIAVLPGSTVEASYTVTNNTCSQRNNNSVTYVPPNVAVDQTRGCTSNFNLAARGQAQDSCTLYLIVSGAVDGTDPTPSHHLFVCFPQNMTCAGTTSPLNVTVTNEVAYIANQTGASIGICPVLNSTFNSCFSFTDSSITQPIDLILNNAQSIAYIANNGGGTIASCLVHSNGSLYACSANTIPTPSPAGLTLNSANSFLYYTSTSDNRVYACLLNSNGSINPANCTAQTITLNGAIRGRVVFYDPKLVAYIAQSTTNSVAICQFNVQGTIFNCNTFNDATFDQPTGMTLDPASTHLYVANSGNSTISICPINSDGTLATCSSSVANNTFNFTAGATNNIASKSYKGSTALYVPNTNTPPTVSVCPIQNDGSLGNCSIQTSTTLTDPTGIFVAVLN